MMGTSRSPTPSAAPKREFAQPEMFLVEPHEKDAIKEPSGSAPSEQQRGAREGGDGDEQQGRAHRAQSGKMAVQQRDLERG